MIKDQIKNDTKESMKAGTAELTGVLRLLSAVISGKEQDKRYRIAKEKPETSEEQLKELSQLTDEETIEAFSSEIKKRREAIALFEKGGRPELAETETREIAIIQKYLPEQIPADELRKMIEASIQKTGAKEIKDTGKIMADLMPSIKGKAETAEVSKIIKELLTPKA